MAKSTMQLDPKAAHHNLGLLQVHADRLSLNSGHGYDSDESHETAASQTVDAPPETTKIVCNLNVHDASASKKDVLLNMKVLPSGSVAVGDLMRVRGIKDSSHDHYHRGGAPKHPDKERKKMRHIDDHDEDPAGDYLFTVEPMPAEMLSKNPDLEFSVSSHTAIAFHLIKGSQVVLSSVDKNAHCASHVEIIYRDQYLARADMWRLVNSELASKCVHRGQKILFMGNIKATVKSIFVRGKKAHSALFHNSTKPVFRSESARYVLFIQMSKEMWDFDAEGSGEIMFEKVINGFLPELFKRWHQMQAKHIISIVLFTRMVYDDQPVGNTTSALSDINAREEPKATQTKDFYRVVVSDLASGDWFAILDRLKKEFKVFSRDTSIRKPEPGDYAPLGASLAAAVTDMPTQVIAGHPSSASRGNVLEAINLASSQFSSDYVDRDLVRTGVSIVIISPGTGVFEVDYDLLAATTENLIDNGVGIDLVCLSRMPLHSVPLFQYKPPRDESKAKDHTNKQTGTYQLPMKSLPSSYGTPSPTSPSLRSFGDPNNPALQWNYGIPHWVDISFWTAAEIDRQQIMKKTPKLKLKPDLEASLGHKPFIPRVKMWELQMMGVMDNADREISIPQLITGDSSALDLSQESKSLGSAEPKHLRETSITSIDSEKSRLGAENAMVSTSPNSLHSKQPTRGTVQIQNMNEYDDAIFRNPRASRRRRVQRRSRHKALKENLSSLQPEHTTFRKSSLNISENVESNTRPTKQPAGEDASDVRTAPNTEVTPRKPGIMPRSISFGLRGLTPKAIATASAKVDITESPAWTTKSAKSSSISKVEPSHGLSSLSAKQDVTSSSAASLRPGSDHEPSLLLSSDSEHQDTRPIPIKNTATVRPKKQDIRRNKATAANFRPLEVQDRVSALTDLREPNAPLTNIQDEEYEVLAPILSPSTTLAPWLTILNPSNPSKTDAAQTARLGRWQHIFPRAPKTSQMKWKSLCSPAAIPLSTEELPTAEELEEEYKRSSYIVTLPEEMDMSEQPRSLVNELLAFRLSRGFQVVVGRRLAEIKSPAAEIAEDVFGETTLNEVGASIYLSRGSTIHHMTRSGIDRLQIEVLTRHSAAAAETKADETPMLYTPAIRSMLSDAYKPRTISIAPQRGSFSWDVIDAFIAGHERPQAAQYVENLRPWRTRFVLIPVDQPSSSRLKTRPSEDNAEEIRLEGIRKLTQLWQRFRFVPPDERGHQPQLRNGKDPNPLDISYQTKDPSAIVAAELDAVLEGDETGRPVHLLPEPDLYQRSNLDIKKLAETIQGEKGVRMLDRRWHLRLHYSCFIGFELTTWLLQNFKDIETREEAEALGKDLMKNGLFKHVEQRHEFRDGNYFYQIEAEYRTPRPESKRWFGRGKSAVQPSVPSTPMTEGPPTLSSQTTRSRASSNADTTASEVAGSSFVEKRQHPSVALSKSLLYDVDHRRRSYRHELINLHYDRLHNPDNCYHIRVEWMNTTPRLIQEAVISWAMNVERFGLRLVQVPIGEASSITSMHPFRAPYEIKLAQRPPTKQPQNYFDATAFGPQPKADPLFYQKAIMKHLNFVLDFEAASSFPLEVEVSYSWGKPDYRYPQYIHRSGLLIAQITDEGDFLILANRLYNSRSATNNPHQDTADSVSDRGPTIPRSSPHRGTHADRPSPFSSPAVHPTTSSTLDIPSGNLPLLSRGPSPTAKPSFVPPSTGSASTGTTASQPSPEKLTRDVQEFCSNAATLEAFYAEVLSKASTPASTPFMPATGRTPLRTPLRKVENLGRESEIPALALPGSVMEASNGGGGGSGVRARLSLEEKDGMKAAMMKVELRRAMKEESPRVEPRESTL